MQNEIYDEKNGLTYMLCGDYYLPELALKDIEPTYGKYGMLRKSYLQEHRRAKYQILLLQGKLVEHLNQIDAEARDREEQLVKQMMEKQGITDNLVLIRKEVNGVYYEGLVMDAVNIQPEQEFKISIGAVNNIGRSAFDGNLRIALVGKNGTIKEYISEEIPVKYPADSYHSETDCFCKITLPIKAGDRIRVYYKGKYSEDWEYLRGGSLLKSEIILKEEDMPLEKMTSFAYDKKNKKISLKTCPQVEYQVLSLTNNVVFSGITNDDNPEIRIDTSELIDREYVIVLRKKIEDEDEYEEKRIRFAIGNQNKK